MTMREAHIGRVLVASLHQAIADVLPLRLGFYENWLHAEGLRDGTIGIAPLFAVLSFLRQEGDAYGEVMERAGVYAADWSVASMSPFARRVIKASPAAMRQRLVLGRAGALVRQVYDGNRARCHVRRGVGRLDVQGSVFCVVREPVSQPLCGFYVAALRTMLALFELGGTVEVASCRGTGADACVLNVPFASAEAMAREPEVA